MNKFRAPVLTAVFAWLLWGAVIAWAQQPAELLQRLDKNQDGKLSKDELPLRMQGRFDRLDSDQDGAVTEKELTAFSKNRKELQAKMPAAQPRPPGQQVKPTGQGTAGRSNAQGEFYAPPAMQERVDSPLQVGDRAPAFSLRQINTEQTIELVQFQGDKPVVLVFGSITCSPFRQQVLEVFNMHQKFEAKAQFLMIYIREAHPESTIMVPNGEGQSSLRKFIQTDSLHARTENAETCATLLKPPFPVLVDAEDNKTLAAYGAWPNRLVVVGKDGRIAWDSGEGPRGFQPRKLEEWLQKNL